MASNAFPVRIGVEDTDEPNFAYLDTIKSGIIGDDGFLATNLITYTGDAWNGKLANLEPSIDAGIRNPQDFDINKLSVEDFGLGLTLNLLELGELLPVIGEIPNWVYGGIGVIATKENGEDIDFNVRYILAVKVEIG